MTALRAIAVSLAAATLVACASSEPRFSDGSPTEAARYNAQLGVAYMQQGDLQLAREKLQRAVEQDPQLGTAHTYLALVYEQLREPDLAGSHYRQAVRVAGDDPNVRNLYGTYLCRQKEIAKAEKQFLEAARNPLYRTPEVAFTNAGVCALQLPDGEEAAEAHFRQALSVNPRFPDALLRLSVLSMDTGQLLAARAFLQRYEAVADDTAQALWLGNRIESGLGDEQAAARYRQTLRAKFPQSEEAGLASEAERSGDRG